jgi:hypothetical protein
MKSALDFPKVPGLVVESGLACPMSCGLGVDKWICLLQWLLDNSSRQVCGCQRVCLRLL